LELFAIKEESPEKSPDKSPTKIPVYVQKEPAGPKK
jgi:hypothetical protein